MIEHAKAQRPTFTEVYMRLARALAERSSCRRLAAGCAIVSADYRQVLAVGYNGNAAGLPNECDRDEVTHECGCLHAEENAVIHCAAARSIPKVVLCTNLPCPMCAKRLINLGGVVRVVYGHESTERAGIAFLERANIQVVSIADLPSAHADRDTR
ncbi:cytidine/deoxycytidylate deaminase family protein [soil metagenome]